MAESKIKAQNEAGVSFAQVPREMGKFLKEVLS